MSRRIPWKRILPLGITLIVLLILFVTAFTVTRRFLENRRREQFQTVLLEAEALLKQGSLLQGRELLDSLRRSGRKNAYHAQEYLRLLKRYHLYARQSGDWVPYLSVAQEAFGHYPGREDLAALTVYGLLREGALEGTVKASRGLRDARFDSLRAELLLRTGSWGEDSEAALSPYQKVMAGREPALFEEAGDQTGLTPFYLDAALLSLEEGDFTNAGRIHRAHLAEEYPLFSLYFTLDRGLLQQAMGYWDTLSGRGGIREETILLKGDILLRNGREEGARQFYTSHLADNPTASWLPYLNLAWLQPDTQKERTLTAGLSLFPEEESLNLAYARMLIRQNREEEAQKVLEAMVPRERQGHKGELLLLRLLAARRSGAFLQGRYWQLLEDYPREPEPAKALGYYLMSWGQWEEAELLFSRAEASLEDRLWIDEWRGISAALSGNPHEGEARLRSVLDRKHTPETLYNTALILGTLGRFEEAQKLLERGIALCAPEDPINGRFYIRRGVFAFEGKNPLEARQAVLKGLEFLPRDLEGLFLLKRLEAEEVFR